MKSDLKKVVIIGAGIGGLSLANLLARDGHDVTVYESRSTPGGRAGELKSDGFTFDTGPSWYLMPEVFERYWQSFGHSAGRDLDIVRLAPSYKVFYESGDPLVITGNIEHDAATFESVEPGAGQGLRAYARRSTKLYELALRYFLYTDFASLRPLLKLPVIMRTGTMIRLMLTPLHTYASRFVRSPRLQHILEYPMVFLGTSPYKAPALYSLMGALDFSQGVFYPRGGIYSITTSLVGIGHGLGVRLVFDAPVTAIRSANTRATGITLADGTDVEADIVISNADLHHTETALLSEPDRSYPETYWRRREPSCSALLLYLGVKGTVDSLEHHNLFFADDWKENFDALYGSHTIPATASLYVSRTSKTDPGVAPDGHETLFALIPLPAGVSLDEPEIEALADRFIAQIETMAGERFADRIVLRRTFGPDDFGSTYQSWQNSMLGQSHVLRQSAMWRTGIRSKKLSGLYYVGGNTLPGIGLPMCLISAQIVADAINKDAGRR